MSNADNLTGFLMGMLIDPKDVTDLHAACEADDDAALREWLDWRAASVFRQLALEATARGWTGAIALTIRVQPVTAEQAKDGFTNDLQLLLGARC